jgi:ABC-type arginine transport system ATPase subunit
VRFRYPGRAGEVLHDVNALLPAGKVTALVGANGAGKSTLVKLLRFEGRSSLLHLWPLTLLFYASNLLLPAPTEAGEGAEA